MFDEVPQKKYNRDKGQQWETGNILLEYFGLREWVMQEGIMKVDPKLYFLIFLSERKTQKTWNTFTCHNGVT